MAAFALALPCFLTPTSAPQAPLTPARSGWLWEACGHIVLSGRYSCPALPLPPDLAQMSPPQGSSSNPR